MTNYQHLLHLIYDFLAGTLSCQDFIVLFEAAYYEGGAEQTTPLSVKPVIESIIQAAALTVQDSILRAESPAYISPVELQLFVEQQALAIEQSFGLSGT